MSPVQLAVWLRGLAIGALGGGLFWVLGLPMPWLMGAMLATIIAGVAGLPGHMPKLARNAVVPVIGVMLGAAFDREALAYLPDIWLILIIALAYTIFIIGAGTVFLMRLGGLDLPTAYFASVPGSFSEMIIVAEERGADLSAIAVVHSARLVVSLTLITFGFRIFLDLDTSQLPMSQKAAPAPFDILLLLGCAVVGYAGGKALRLPSPQLFGPLVLSAITHLSGTVEGAPPGWTIAIAQVFIGIFIGARFGGVAFGQVRRLMALSVAWAVLLVLAALMMAEIALLSLGLPLKAAFLAFAPGGAVEISIVALGAGVSLSLVTAIHFIRSSFSILLAPALFRLLARLSRVH